MVLKMMLLLIGDGKSDVDGEGDGNGDDNRGGDQGVWCESQ